MGEAVARAGQLVAVARGVEVRLGSGLISGGRRERTALRNHHKYQHTRGSIRPRRTGRGVNGARRLEERAAHWEDLFRLVVDGKTHLALHDVPEDGSRMTVPRA